MKRQMNEGRTCGKFSAISSRLPSMKPKVIVNRGERLRKKKP